MQNYDNSSTAPNPNTHLNAPPPLLTPSEIKKGIQKAKDAFIATPHEEILGKLLKQLTPVDNWRKRAELKDDQDKVTVSHLVVICIEEIQDTAKRSNWNLCRNYDFIYLYNGAFWKILEDKTLLTFLGEAAETLGIDKFKARHHKFRDELLKQFLAVSNLPKPNLPKDVVLINLLNGTFVITPQRQYLRAPNPADFLTYQLPFAYDPKAQAPRFHAFLNRVQPEGPCQMVLAEYLGYIFVKTSTLKLEKILLLYGTGANGKSVFYELTQALFGRANVSSYSLQSLTDQNGYYRSMLANTLVNYASEINGRLETQYFKALASGEALEARRPYKEPFTLEDYAKLIFNCNELPREVEHTNAYFRRWLIVPFEVTIPEAEQDKELSKKIIDNELSGVFNWVLDGLRRLMQQKKFSPCDAIERQLEQFKRQSDNVRMFVEEESYAKSSDRTINLKELYAHFRSYCGEGGFIPCNNRNFADRLRHLGYQSKKTNAGQVFYMQQIVAI